MAPDAKAMARDQIAQGGRGRRVRQARGADPGQRLDSPWWIDDVTMAGKARPDGILVPKISSVADLNAIADRLSDINADISIRVWAMIETSRAVLDADKLAAASKRFGNAARGLRVRAERYFARDADPDAAGPRRDDPDDHALHPGDPRARPRNSRRALQRYQQRRRLCGRMRAGPRPRLRRQDADPSEPDRGLQRDLHAAGGGSRRKPARSSRRSSSRKTPRAARSSSTAGWWSGCTPTWPSARSRSRTRSRRWGVERALPLPWGKVARMRIAPDEGSLSRQSGETRLTASLRVTLPQGRVAANPRTSPPPMHRGCRESAAGCRGLSAKCAAR